MIVLHLHDVICSAYHWHNSIKHSAVTVLLVRVEGPSMRALMVVGVARPA